MAVQWLFSIRVVLCLSAATMATREMCAATACLRVLGVLSSVMGGLPVAGWPLHPRPWPAGRAWAAVVVSVVPLLEVTRTSIVTRHSPLVIVGIASMNCFWALAKAWDVVGRFSCCAMLRWVRRALHTQAALADGLAASGTA